MWKLFAVGLSVLKTAQAIQHPVFFQYQDRLNADSGVGVLSADFMSTAATVVYPETVTVCVQFLWVISLAIIRAY